MKTIKPILQNYVLPNLPYHLVFWLANKLGMAYRVSSGKDFLQRLIQSIGLLNEKLSDPLPSLAPFDIIIGITGAVLVYISVAIKKKNAKKYRKDVEHGSARWGTPRDIQPYIDPNPENNIILTQTERLMMGNRPKNPAHARNKNVLVIGGSGSGKTRFFIKPNLMQCRSTEYPVSFCITDPKGLLC